MWKNARRAVNLGPLGPERPCRHGPCGPPRRASRRDPRRQDDEALVVKPTVFRSATNSPNRDQREPGRPEAFRPERAPVPRRGSSRPTAGVFATSSWLASAAPSYPCPTGTVAREVFDAQHPTERTDVRMRPARRARRRRGPALRSSRGGLRQDPDHDVVRRRRASSICRAATSPRSFAPPTPGASTSRPSPRTRTSRSAISAWPTRRARPRSSSTRRRARRRWPVKVSEGERHMILRRSKSG